MCMSTDAVNELAEEEKKKTAKVENQNFGKILHNFTHHET